MDTATEIVLNLDMENLTTEQILWLHRLKGQVMVLNGWRQIWERRETEKWKR